MKNLLKGKYTLKQLADMVDGYETIALITGNYKPVTVNIDVCVPSIDTDFNTGISANDIEWLKMFLSKMCGYGDGIADKIINHKYVLGTGNMFHANGRLVQVYVDICGQ